VAALSALLRIGQGADEVQAFHDRWQDDRLVMDKWFTLQVVNAPGATGAAVAARLTQHPAFDWKNPNRFRAVIGALGANHAGFHAADGSGYRLLADWLIRLDPLNPQTTARMTTMFETWRRYDGDRQDLAREALERIAGAEGLSRDTSEMVTRILGSVDG
uniref:aminopeptidase N C-terminal domain-containing protein n=1 Tax=Palleronia sp. TaxID=1940284 RepID=UPI0035C87E56